MLGWAAGLSLEGLAVLEASTEGTDFERLAQSGFAEVHIAEDGTAFATIGVLSFGGNVTLPTGSSEILRATCRVARKDPGVARVIPRDGFSFPGSDAPLRNEVVTTGGTVVPLVVHPAQMDVTGCAQLAMSPVGVPGEGQPVRIEVRRGGILAADLEVVVASESHLGPEGLTVGVAHDPAILEIRSADFLDDFARSFVLGDGFTVVETSERGFAASALSSASTPASLPPGTHRFLRASYALVAAAPPGAIVTTTLAFADDLPLGAGTSIAAFRPGDARPCGPEDLTLELEVAQDPWIRGDSNGDGHVDISDAITTLGHLFLGAPAGCERGAEVNLDGEVDLTDAIALLGHLFLGRDPPPPPFPDCGMAESDLACEVNACTR